MQYGSEFASISSSTVDRSRRCVVSWSSSERDSDTSEYSGDGSRKPPKKAAILERSKMSGCVSRRSRKLLLCCAGASGCSRSSKKRWEGGRGIADKTASPPTPAGRSNRPLKVRCLRKSPKNWPQKRSQTYLPLSPSKTPCTSASTPVTHQLTSSTSSAEISCG